MNLVCILVFVLIVVLMSIILVGIKSIKSLYETIEEVLVIADKHFQILKNLQAQIDLMCGKDAKDIPS